MEIPPSLLTRLNDNEKIARKFNEIEISILTILNFQDFLERLLFEISDKFSIGYIWISIIEESSIAKQLHDIQNSQLLKTSTAFVPKEKFLSVTQNSLKPLLANENLEFFDALVPEIADYNVGSIAIAPITLDGTVIGSINQADKDKTRFEPGIDTSLLEQLALKVSLCLSNVTAHEQLKFLAFHDPLTGLLNRRVMERILEREFLRAKRYKIELTLLFLDLDDFKSINDTFGHDNGDRALCHISNSLNQLKRDSDIVARFAGDEFVVIFPSTTRAQAENYINRVRKNLDSSPLSANDTSFFIKLSYGISTISEKDIDSSKALLKQADKRLYKAKQEKNNN
ncbi:MAG: sensor domain-containing diguanylate cyclase [Desulfobacteraceae bacterium]|nr:sensor domain-containing diguanylate cyclase [Desulfobacteraceae bacterium]